MFAARLPFVNTITRTGTGASTIVTGSASDVITLGSGVNSVTGAAGADQININHGTATNATTAVFGANATVAAAAGANMDTINNFTTTLDKFNLTVSAATAATSTLNVVGANTTTVATLAAPVVDATSVATLANVYTQLALDLSTFAASASGVNGIVARAVTFANGAAAGTYLVINDGVNAFQAANDVVIKLTGLTIVAAGDFSYTNVP